VRYAAGPLAGGPALTRNGNAWYLTTRPDPGTLDRWLAWMFREAGVAPAVHAVPSHLEAVRRGHPDGDTYLFLINHGTDDVDVPAAGKDLLTGAVAAGAVRVPAGEVVVLCETTDGGVTA